jgi:predicted CopG family antitoxin
MTERKNLKIASDTYDDLLDEKRDMETWDSMLRRLLRDGGEE